MEEGRRRIVMLSMFPTFVCIHSWTDCCSLSYCKAPLIVHFTVHLTLSSSSLFAGNKVNGGNIISADE